MFIAANVPDLTHYAVETWAKAPAEAVPHARRHDVAAWRSATENGIARHRVLGSAVWPPEPISTTSWTWSTEDSRSSPMSLSDLPPLDCHAHIAPDVTRAQIASCSHPIHTW